MEVRSILFACAVAALILGLVWPLIWRARKARSSRSTNWDALLGRLAPVDRDRIAWIAKDLLWDGTGDDEAPPASPLEPSDIYRLIGGLDGLYLLESNCEVLIDLACYVQTLYPEALLIAEQLRLNAREIQWTISRLVAAAERGHLDSTFPDYAQRAVATYYGMTQRLLELYATLELPELWQLQRAV